jgi:hypothetical protein
MAITLEGLTLSELLALHADIGGELQRRGVCRTANNPVADFTEWLVARKLGLRLDGNSQAGFDATDQAGVRYQIKGRRLAKPKAPPQLSVIRNLANAPFHYLIGVIFHARFQVAYAAQVPHAVVERLSVYNRHQNGHILHLKPSIFAEPGVVNLTAKLQEIELAAAQALPSD